MSTDLRRELHAFVERIVDAIEAQSTGSEWVDQTNSPLGRRRHLELARKGVLRSTKDAGKVRIRRSDIEAYLLKNTVIRVDENADLDREAARVLATMGRKAS